MDRIKFEKARAVSTSTELDPLTMLVSARTMLKMVGFEGTNSEEVFDVLESYLDVVVTACQPTEVFFLPIQVLISHKVAEGKSKSIGDRTRDVAEINRFVGLARGELVQNIARH